MPGRTHQKNLAKRRRAREMERVTRQRRRKQGAWVATVSILVVAAVIGMMVFFGGDEEDVAPDTGTVACGARRPGGADIPKTTYKKTPDPEEVLKEGTNYTAVVNTSCGSFTVDLYEEDAPQTVATFVFLGKESFYDGLTFHRLIPGFMVQGGDPQGDGTGGPGFEYGLENEDAKFNAAGQVAMANGGPDSNGSQFFVTFDAASHLNDGYTMFGEVTEGMDTIDAIEAITVSGETPNETIYIDSVEIIEN